MKRLLSVSFGLVLMLGAVGLADDGRIQAGGADGAPRVFGTAAGQGRGYLGVELGEVNSETARRLGMSEERGAQVVGVLSDGPAAKAGLQKDDVIVSWNGERVESAMQLSRHLRETPAGRSVRIGAIRGGRQIEMEVKLGERSGRAFALPARAATTGVVVGPRARLGLGLQSLTAQLAEYFGLSKRSGVLVVSVAENSGAAKAGLKAGDVILSVDGQAIERTSDVARALRGKQEGNVEVKVFRDKHERSFSVQLEKGSTSWLVEPDDIGDFEIEPIDLVIPPIEIPLVEFPKFVVPKVELPRIQIPKIEIRSSGGRRVVV